MSPPGVGECHDFSISVVTDYEALRAAIHATETTTDANAPGRDPRRIQLSMIALRPSVDERIVFGGGRFTDLVVTEGGVDSKDSAPSTPLVVLGRVSLGGTTGWQEASLTVSPGEGADCIGVLSHPSKLPTLADAS